MEAGKKVLMTGATGMVGGEALKACLDNDEVGKVISLLRRSSGLTHEKLTEVVVEDFQDYSGLEAHFQEFNNASAFRPGYIYPVEKRKEPSFMYRVTRRLYPLLKAIGPGSVIPSRQLGQAMLVVGLKGGKLKIYENKDILAIDPQKREGFVAF